MAKTVEDYGKMVEIIPGEDETEYLYRMSMGLKMDLLDFLRRNPGDNDLTASAKKALDQINEAAKVYEVIAHMKLVGIEESDDEFQEEDVVHQPIEEISPIEEEETIEACSVVTIPFTPDGRLEFHILDEEPEDPKDLELAELGAAKLWEYTQWLRNEGEESDTSEVTTPEPESEKEIKTPSNDWVYTEETIASTTTDEISPEDETGDDTLNCHLQSEETEPTPEGEPPDVYQNEDVYYETKSDRELIIEGRVFDVGKLVITPISEQGVKIGSEDQNIILTNQDNEPKKEKQSDQRQNNPDPVDLTHEDNILKFFPNEDHKVKENVNSPCSQVWKIKADSTNGSQPRTYDHRFKPESLNKQLKPGWDPPYTNIN